MCPGCNVYYSIDGMDIGREGAVVLFRVQDEFGETLDCVWRVGLKECC